MKKGYCSNAESEKKCLRTLNFLGVKKVSFGKKIVLHHYLQYSYTQEELTG